ncbi:rod shape-determining protein MreD [Terasakiella sp. SH-1]|uniref:rod shape-determining protein MreD n=1 Tax=Terasakiella sp. SH-1 TaxID=2560057 RepID=UPI001073C84D|nr:rod shape-determining protein MreD [Terasakiella sp. SH-1]
MKPAFWQRLDLWARNISPVGLSVVLILLSVIPTHIPGYGSIVPQLALMGVFHWTVFRPDLFPILAVFSIGILQDALSGAPMGLNTIVYLTVFGVVLGQRRFFLGKTFLVEWLGFSIIAAGAAVQAWLLLSAYHVHLMAPGPVFFQYFMTMGLYPPMAWVMGRWQRSVLR